MAALNSGALDFVLDPPAQDIERLRQDKNIRIYQGPETAVFFLGMDQQRDDLLYSSLKGRNPFKDVNVRRAIHHAIDTDAIIRTALRGFGLPVALVLSNPERAGVTADMNKRSPPDVALAKRLLAQAGYPEGFAVTMDCDARNERVCSSIAGMLAKIGITLNLAVQSPAQFYQKIRRLDTSMYLMGWVSALDPIFMLQPVVHSRNDRGDGEWNYGNFKDPRIDALIDEAKVEFDESRRRSLFLEVAKINRDNAYLIPLYRRVAPWVSRANVEVVHRPDTWLETRWVKIQ
jgi:peptide/nickel transport system substrate-binding protein